MTAEVNRSVAEEGPGWSEYVAELRRLVDQSQKAEPRGDQGVVFEPSVERMFELDAA